MRLSGPAQRVHDSLNALVGSSFPSESSFFIPITDNDPGDHDKGDRSDCSSDSQPVASPDEKGKWGKHGNQHENEDWNGPLVSEVNGPSSGGLLLHVHPWILGAVVDLLVARPVPIIVPQLIQFCSIHFVFISCQRHPSG